MAEIARSSPNRPNNGHRKIGRCGSSMLRPSLDDGTLWLHNDDDDDDDDYKL